MTSESLAPPETQFPFLDKAQVARWMVRLPWGVCWTLVSDDQLLGSFGTGTVFRVSMPISSSVAWGPNTSIMGLLCVRLGRVETEFGGSARVLPW